MRVLGLQTRDASELTVEETIEAVLEELGADGRVALIRMAEGAPDRTGAAITVSLGRDGGWAAAGSDGDLGEAIDAVAPHCEYAVIVGEEPPIEPSISANEDIGPDQLRRRVAETEPHETLEALVSEVKRSDNADRAGAIATFTGRVRRRDGPEDPPTTHLEFEKYDRVADERLASIREELMDREGVHEVALHHRTGIVEAGEDIVFVVVLAGHRAEAFRTVEDGIDRLKAEVPIFKREVTVEDEFWRHER